MHFIAFFFSSFPTHSSQQNNIFPSRAFSTLLVIPLLHWKPNYHPFQSSITNQYVVSLISDQPADKDRKPWVGGELISLYLFF
jgi:hypothetical protein